MENAWYSKWWFYLFFVHLPDDWKTRKTLLTPLYFFFPFFINVSSFIFLFFTYFFLSAFFYPHFSIRIFLSVFSHPPSAAIRSTFYRHPWWIMLSGLGAMISTMRRMLNTEECLFDMDVASNYTRKSELPKILAGRFKHKNCLKISLRFLAWLLKPILNTCTQYSARTS